MSINKQTFSLSSFNELKEEVFFDSEALYLKFINWTSGEFDLYLQDESDELKVFFPGGKFHIKGIAENGKVIAKITVESSTIKNGQLIVDKIMYNYQLLMNH